MIQLSVIIPTHNRANKLRACLEALGRQTCPADDFEVIVVVDGSMDGTREMLATIATPFRLTVVWQAAGGQMAALNQGLRAATSQFCLFLDDDILAGLELVAEHLRAQLMGANVLGIGRLTLRTGADAGWFARQNSKAWDEHYARLASGEKRPSWKACYSGNLSAPRAAVLAENGFAVDLPVAADIELAYRLEQSGLRPIYLPQAWGEHDDPKDEPRLLQEIERQGRAYMVLAGRHTCLLPELLGRFGDTGLGRLALRWLLALRAPPRAVAALHVFFAGPELTRRYYDFVRQYCHWRGVARDIPSRDLWRRVTSPVIILMYHGLGRAGEPASRYFVPARRFAAHLRWIKRLGYQVISLEGYLKDLKAGSPPAPRSVILTLDDGYAELFDLAYPLLRSKGFPATVFLVSACIGGANSWDSVGPTAGRPVLSWSQIREMQAGGISFGAHTQTHPRLIDISLEAAETEIAGSRQALESALSVPVVLFAYPYGKQNAQVRTLVERAGYLGACSTIDGVNDLSTPMLALRRIEVEGTDSLARLFVALWSGSGDWGRRAQRR